MWLGGGGEGNILFDAKYVTFHTSIDHLVCRKVFKLHTLIFTPLVSLIPFISCVPHRKQSLFWKCDSFV